MNKEFPDISEKYEKLRNILKKMKRVLVAFSGGVDSTFLLKVAHDVLGDDVLAVIAASETYPDKEREEAIRLAEKMNVRYRIIQTKELENPDFVSNSPQRCYFCKKELFSKLKEIAHLEGISYVLDGANFDDLEDFRPGANAAEELGIHSPLKDAHLLKNEIREISMSLGLPTWDKPSMACLSSRFPYYTAIDEKGLNQVRQAEDFLKSLGFSQLRVRHHGLIARIEVKPEEIPKIIEPGVISLVIENLKKAGYTYVTLDLSGYRTGSMNEPLRLETRRKNPKSNE